MNTRLHLNRYLATGVGSLPHSSPSEACDLVFRYFKDDIPFWPQLPKKDFRENMYVQFTQGLPGVVIDQAGKKIYIDTAQDNYAKALEAAYERYLAEDLDYFAISPDYAGGFYEFIKRIKGMNPAFIKGQIIGPVSFGLAVTDQHKKAIIYEQEFRDCLTKVLIMKARWQVRKLRDALDAGRGPQDKPQIIIFIDEPYLVSIGSSFFNITIEDVLSMLNDCIAAIHSEGAFAGIHCCGNTDWGIVLKTNIDILNFDAYNYAETIFLYPKELDSFLQRNGILAWGIVPTHLREDLPALESLLKKMAPERGAFKQSFSLLSPACGLSGVPLERAEEILALTLRLTRSL
ncbi:MAG: hypothetical protein A3J51_02700 [Omnitrophica WOR_2 bacterium RIFCSPHIGHO2_02_FULL_45_21]|nr:MAG: hypothetical protein A3J51_02700 [Omnitrophica WOR_2 bacterium RIFCSPHIGHO2_02_FULL_45_21]